MGPCDADDPNRNIFQRNTTEKLQQNRQQKRQRSALRKALQNVHPEAQPKAEPRADRKIHLKERVRLSQNDSGRGR